ncbi:MAG: hypothetical protein M1819_001643 [Sarea resinae]|nr:MAG: hypothetical protein M1819_001643 [Sarea resinae]
MGYSEVVCHLCGVSFDIARTRKADEPREFAWGCYGFPGLSWIEGDGRGCSTDTTGCCFVVRGDPRRVFDKKKDDGVDAGDDDDDDDLDYVYQSDDGNEPCEYESGDDMELDQDMSTDHAEVDDDDDDDEEEEEEEKEDDPWVQKWLEDFKSRTKSQAPPKDDVLPMPRVEGRRSHFDGHKIGHLEHIAGPGCTNTAGYNGHKITFEEMEACLTNQCLVRKGSNWTPDALDQDFELTSDYFLSGLSDYMPSRDDRGPRVTPARHGMEMPHAETYIWERDNADQYDMPFHPWCFNIFARLSRLHFGRVDVNGLMSWRNLEGDYKAFSSFPRDPDVKRGSSQNWDHHPGSEYLAANPLFVPGLPSLLTAAIKIDEEPTRNDGRAVLLPGRPGHSGTGTYSALNHRHDAGLPAAAALPVTVADTSDSYDPFLTLPEELRLHLVDYLDSSDIAHLRQTSRAFQQLPNSLWYRILRREMPWLWEIWSRDTPSVWATIRTAQKIQDLLALDDAEAAQQREFRNQLQLYRDVIHEEMPDIYDAFRATEPAYHDLVPPRTPSWPPPPPLHHAAAASPSPLELPRDRTDWHKLFASLKRHGPEMKGLRNRRRIWKDVEEIVRRIEKGRDEGKIVD